MSHTELTIGGFIQPSIARNLIEIQANVEKGPCQRFLWLVPQPTAVPFERLQKVDEEFSTSIGILHKCYQAVHCINMPVVFIFKASTNEHVYVSKNIAVVMDNTLFLQWV